MKYRKYIRFFVFLMMFIIPILNTYEFYGITGTFYAINIGGLGIADPSAIVQSIFAAGEITIPLLTAALFPIGMAFIFGRVWCGWMCPFHVLTDIAAGLRKFFGLRSDKPLPIPNTFRANAFRFMILILGTATAGALSIPVLNYINAPGILSTEAMIFVKERVFSLEMFFILGILVLEIAILPRFWCRLFCPTGTVLSGMRSGITMKVENQIQNPKSPCCKEHACGKVCPMGLDPYRESKNSLCTNCGLCIKSCSYDRLSYAGFFSQNLIRRPDDRKHDSIAVERERKVS